MKFSEYINIELWVARTKFCDEFMRKFKIIDNEEKDPLRIESRVISDEKLFVIYREKK